MKTDFSSSISVELHFGSKNLKTVETSRTLSHITQPASLVSQFTPMSSIYEYDVTFTVIPFSPLEIKVSASLFDVLPLRLVNRCSYKS